MLLASISKGSQGDYQNRVDSFFAHIKDGKYKEAVDFIYSDNPRMSVKSDDIQKVKNQFTGLPDLVGSYLGHELLYKKVAADRFVHLHYFVVYERQPVSFKFEFYRPKNEWIIYSFAYDFNFDELLEEKAKLNFYYDESTSKK